MKYVKAVRWMNAYFGEGKYTDLESAIRWEITQKEREVAFAFQRPETQLRGALVGLLVDMEKSTIRCRFKGDAWTVNKSGTLVNTRSYPIRIKNNQTPRISTHRGWEQWYDEGVGRLVFSGIVVHQSANKKVRKEAARIAKKVGLPYLGTLTIDT